MNDENRYMQRCLSIAGQGLGSVSPNPMVGCVIVHNDKIIGEGYHRQYGGPHAEVNAFNCVIDKSLLIESTVYVNLEPCSHFGKTPPCADLLIEHKVKEVIIASTDPNPLVAGKGIEKLRKAGIIVKTGILEDEAKMLNKRFYSFHEQHRPYIIMKWAKTKDGFMDIERKESGGNLKYWITNDELKILVHKWRTEEAAILVGSNTALNDNPQLNIRYWQGNQPLRLVLDENLSLPADLHLFDGKYPTVVFTAKQAEDKPNLSFVKIDFSNLLNEIMAYLYSINITSVLVEGGKELLLTFINEGLWDEARILTGNKTFGKGLEAPELNGVIDFETEVNGDFICIMKNSKKSK